MFVSMVSLATMNVGVHGADGGASGGRGGGGGPAAASATLLNAANGVSGSAATVTVARGASLNSAPVVGSESSSTAESDLALSLLHKIYAEMSKMQTNTAKMANDTQHIANNTSYLQPPQPVPSSLLRRAGTALFWHVVGVGLGAVQQVAITLLIQKCLSGGSQQSVPDITQLLDKATYLKEKFAKTKAPEVLAKLEVTKKTLVNLMTIEQKEFEMELATVENILQLENERAKTDEEKKLFEKNKNHIQKGIISKQDSLRILHLRYLHIFYSNPLAVQLPGAQTSGTSSTQTPRPGVAQDARSPIQGVVAAVA